ncbi:MAG: DNA-binding protein [Desulfobacteraceae bacterium]|nr:MAG: DNA-binding protein [Desulfobacteraceae bacterium]
MQIERSIRMADSKAMLTTQQFALQAGVSTSTVSKWLRNGKLEGRKQDGKWMISADQLTRAIPSQGESAQAKSGAAAANGTLAVSAAKPCAAGYTVEEFSTLTYLTCFGVQRFLREGRLTGTRDSSGRWRVDAANLENSNIQHLRRK